MPEQADRLRKVLEKFRAKKKRKGFIEGQRRRLKKKGRELGRKYVEGRGGLKKKGKKGSKATRFRLPIRSGKVKAFRKKPRPDPPIKDAFFK